MNSIQIKMIEEWIIEDKKLNHIQNPLQEYFLRTYYVNSFTKFRDKNLSYINGFGVGIAQNLSFKTYKRLMSLKK